MNAADPSRPLANARHEAFCRHYAGDCHGNAAAAYIAAGYRVRSRASAASAGWRLLRIAEAVRARAKYLRERAILAVAVDRLEILRIRAGVLNDPRAPAWARLRAATDLEKSLGLGPPVEADATSGAPRPTEPAGGVHVESDALTTLQTYIAEIKGLAVPNGGGM